MSALALYFLCMPPVCAVVTGMLVWANNRHYALEDGPLVRQFLLVLAICLSIAWGISQTRTMRLRLDPQFKLQTELEANPVYTALQRLQPDDHRKLLGFLAVQIAQGKTLAEAFLQARPLLTQLARERLGWVDQKTTLAWARLTTETLQELLAQDPQACYRALMRPSPEAPNPSISFSAANTEAFARTVVAVYESAQRGISHQHTPGERRVEFNEAAREYSVIKDSIAQRFGGPIAQLIASKTFADPATQAPGQVCAAMIFQLETMQDRPPEMAYPLLQSVLR